MNDKSTYCVTNGFDAKFKPLKSYKHIVFCFPHANSLGIVRAIAKGGLNPIVVCIGKINEDSGFFHSKYVKECCCFATPSEGLDFIIRNFSDENHKNFLYLMADFGIRICDERYDELKNSFFFFNSGKANYLSPYLNKDKLCDLAVSCGLPVPNFEIVKRGCLPKKLTYPIFIKTNNSFANWKSDAGIAHNEQELVELCDSFASDEWMMEDFIDKKFEDSWQGISVNGGQQVYMPYRKRYVRLRKNDYGTYMYYKACQPPKEIAAGIQQMLRSMNFSGCFEVEFLLDKNDQLHFLEINPRFSASNQGMFAGGVNMPLEWALSVLKGNVDEASIMLRKSPYYVMNEFMDFSKHVLSGNISIIKWIKDLKNSLCLYYYQKGDTSPFYSELKIRIQRKIKKIFKKQ